ncbi:autotransporter domain-containing protein, partial [Campylobacter upsaliensis]|nr:autotransporter domain-containing protein [Campylobacter upsaliensis]
NLKRTALSCTLLTTLLTSASAARDITGNHNAFAINGETVTIKSGATVQVGSPVIGKYKGSNSSIAVGQNGKESSITIEQGGKLNGRIYTRAAKIKDIIINGSIGAGPSNASIINFRSTTIEKIEVGQTGVLEGGIINSWFKNGGTASGNSKIDNIDIKGEVKGGIKNQSGTMQTITITGSVSGGIQNDDTMDTLKIESGGSVSGDIINNKTMQNISVSGSTVNNNIQNSGTISGVTIANSQIGGNIVNSGTNANTGAINITGTSNVGGSIINQNGANFTNSITLDQSSKLGGISNTQGSTMSGQLTLKGEVGEINNAGKFDSTLTLSNKVGQINNAEGGTITNDITINNGGSVGAINNAGTMQAITNNGTGTLTLTNSGGTIDKITNGTGATATIRNQGKITNGIINDGGTLTVFNDFRKDESAANGYHTIGEIGKTANGVHIENKNNGKLHLNAWYFNKEDYATAEERKNNALLVDGDYAGITLGDVFVNTQGLDVDKTYNANTLIADKNGNIVGDKINNGQGIDVNKLYSVSGIYKFENFGGKGEYRAIINRDELSGKTLAQSIIYSQRVRNVNLSRILREATTQVFVSGKESEVNGKSLSQLERLHTNHRDENSQNHTFVIPYYQNFSADLGNNAKLKSNSSGMLIATQRELPNDYGVLGIYTGFENAEQKVNAQRLDLDGNSYYAGLTYNHSFYEDDLTTYFMNLTTKLDYIERDVTKTYLGYIGSVSSTAKVFGYGANARVGLSHYLKNDAKITPQIGFNYLGMHSKPFTLNHLGGTREHYYSQNFNFIDAVATIKYETPWINRFKTSLALGTIINVYKDAEGTLHLDNNFLSSELDIARLYGVVQGGISYDLTKDSDISLGYSGIFSSANTIRSHAFMFRYAWWW